MNKKLKENRGILLFSFAWLLVNLLQARFTELHDDEAYYWVYSLFPAWGYFDHPPMVAVLVRLGYALFRSELGVRLFPALLGAGSVFLIYRLLPGRSRDLRLYILVVTAISLMHINVAGFMALPDVPLVFFTCLFFLVLQKYLGEDRIIQGLALGILAALMLYSKYHALLILFFTILSNRRLLLRRTFWMTAAVALILFIPHILWQVRNGFASFEFHLVSRSTPFQLRHILEYLGNQVVVTGPFIGIPMLYLAFSRRAGNAFERALKFNLFGFFGFFLLSSVRGHVEPHWTAAAFPPMIILALTQARESGKLRKWLHALGIATIPVVLVLRTYLVVDFLPLPDNVSRLFHRKEIWVKQIEEVAGDRPVVFRNKFQYPSVYWFYTGKPAFTRNSIYYRRNQYDIWDIEHQLQGRKVFLAAYGGNPGTDTLSTVFGNVYYYNIERYCSFNNLDISIPEGRLTAAAGDTLTVTVRIENPNRYPVCLDCPCDMPPYLVGVFAGSDGKFTFSRLIEDPVLTEIGPGDAEAPEVRLKVPGTPGRYRFMFSFRSNYLYPGINGGTTGFEITPSMSTGNSGRS